MEFIKYEIDSTYIPNNASVLVEKIAVFSTEVNRVEALIAAT